MASNFYFGATGDIEDGDDYQKSPKSSKDNASIPVGDEDDTEITDDDIEDPNNIPLVEDETKKSSKKSSTKKKVEEDEEDEDEEEEIEEEEDEKETEEEDDDELSSITLVARDLIQKGILSPKEGEDYDDSDAGLAKLFEDSVEAKILEDVPAEYASILDAIKQGIPAKDWVDLVTPDENLKDADLDDEDNQEILVARVAKSQGLSDEQIAKRIKRFKTLDILKDEAEEALAILIKEDERKASEANKEIIETRKKLQKEQQDRINKIHKDAESLTEVQGVFLNKKSRKELADYVTKPVNAQGQTQYIIDRNDPELLLEAAFLVKNAKNKTIQKVAESKATKSLKDKLDKKDDRITSRKGGTVKENINSNRMPQGVPWMNEIQVED